MRARRSVLSVAVTLLLVIVSGCSSAQQSAAPAPTVGGGSLVVLGGDGVLTAFATRNLSPQWRLDLRSRDRTAGLPGQWRHVLAVDARRQVYVAAPPWLFVVDGGTGEVRVAVSLPPGVDWLAPAVVDDGVYLAGADRTGAPMVALVDAVAHQVTDTALLRPAAGHRWLAYATAVSPDGSRLAVSYDGGSALGSGSGLPSAMPHPPPPATGLDMVDLGELQPVGCPPGAPGVGCVAEARGGVAAYPGGLVAVTGTGTLVQLDGTGKVAGHLTTGLAASGSEEITVDTSRLVAYVLRPCADGGGLAMLALPAGQARLLVRQGTGAACGRRVLVAARGGALAVVDAGRLSVLDPSNGTVLEHRDVTVPVVDAVAMP